MTAIALSFDDVEPTRGRESWRTALALEVVAGSFLTLVTAPAVATSFIRLALGFDAPYSGVVRVLGEEPSRLSRSALRSFRRRVGSSLVPDGLMANSTLRGNITLPLVFGDGCSMREANDRADELFERFELTGWADRRPSDLPPDRRQVASVARAVCARPELLLLHDPLTIVPNAEAVNLLTVIRQYATTIIALVHGEDEPVCAVSDVCAAWDVGGYRELARG